MYMYIITACDCYTMCLCFDLVCLEAGVAREMERGSDAGAATTTTASERGTGDVIETGVTEIEGTGTEVIGETGRGVIGGTGMTVTGDTGIEIEIGTRIHEGGIDRDQDRLNLVTALNTTMALC